MRNTFLVVGVLGFLLLGCSDDEPSRGGGGDPGGSGDPVTSGDAGDPGSTDGDTVGGDGDNGGALVDVSGTLVVHPASAAIAGSSGTDLTFGSQTDFLLQLVDPVDLIVNPTGFTPQAQVQIQMASCSPTVCAWSIPAVDFSGLTLGLVAVVIDARASGSQQFVKSMAGVAGSSTVADYAANPRPFTAPPLFTISDESVDALAAVLPPTSADMIQNGFIFGLALNAGGDPVSNVTVSPVSSELTTYYVNDAFDASASATNARGFFLLVSVASNVVITEVSATGSEVWVPITVSTTPTIGFSFEFRAN